MDHTKLERELIARMKSQMNQQENIERDFAEHFNKELKVKRLRDDKVKRNLQIERMLESKTVKFN